MAALSSRHVSNRDYHGTAVVEILSKGLDEAEGYYASRTSVHDFWHMLSDRRNCCSDLTFGTSSTVLYSTWYLDTSHEMLLQISHQR